MEGKVAFITGGDSGIGAGTARVFAQAGAKIVLVARDKEKLDKFAEELRRDSGGKVEVLCCPANVADPTDMENAVKKTVDKFGRIDCVFANAGLNGVWAPIEEIEPEEWDHTMNVNLKGSYLTCKYTVPIMKKQKSGSIVFCSSINGNRTFSHVGATAYSCSKVAQVAMAKQLALELAKHRIRVNVVCPGAIESNIPNNTFEKPSLEAEKEPIEFPGKEVPVPLTGGKKGKPEDVGNVVLFLCSERAGHVSGTEVYVDGAESLFGY
jgi:NAD(P)-dependent dehydrogenase (short-subunit alcohol dehydrogenase family)